MQKIAKQTSVFGRSEVQNEEHIILRHSQIFYTIDHTKCADHFVASHFADFLIQAVLIWRPLSFACLSSDQTFVLKNCLTKLFWSFSCLHQNRSRGEGGEGVVNGDGVGVPVIFRRVLSY